MFIPIQMMPAQFVSLMLAYTMYEQMLAATAQQGRGIDQRRTGRRKPNYRKRTRKT